MYINFLTRRTVQSKQPKTWHNVFMGLIFAIIGIALLCFSVLLIKTYNEKNETFIETTSKVVIINIMMRDCKPLLLNM